MLVPAGCSLITQAHQAASLFAALMPVLGPSQDAPEELFIFLLSPCDCTRAQTLRPTLAQLGPLYQVPSALRSSWLFCPLTHVQCSRAPPYRNNISPGLQYNGCFSHGCDQIPNRNNFRVERFVLICSLLQWEGWMAEWVNYWIPELVVMVLCKLPTKDAIRHSGLGYNLTVHTQ